MQFLTILTIQLFLFAIGFLVSILFGLKNKREIVGLSYLFGSGLITLLVFLVHWLLNYQFNQTTVVLTMLITFVFLLLEIIVLKRIKVIKNFFTFDKKTIKNSFSKTEKFILAFIIIFAAYGIFENYFWPIIDWDALAFYDFRARVIALNGNMLEGIELKYFFQYPPYTSLLHVFGYIFDAERVKIVYSFIYFSALLSFYSLLRRKQDRLVSLFFTLILSSFPMIFQHSIMAYSNLSYTAFFSTGLMYLWLYYESGKKRDLLTGGFLMGLSTWVRSTEPFWLIGLFVILLSLFKNRKNFLISLLSISFLNFPNKLWREFLIYLDNSSDIKIIDTNSHTTDAIKDFILQKQSILNVFIRSYEVVKYLIVTLSPDFFMLFSLLVLTVIGNNRKNKVEMWSLLIAFGIIFAGTLIFSFTFDTWDQIGGSIARMSMIFIPLLLFIIAKDLQYDKKN